MPLVSTSSTEAVLNSTWRGCRVPIDTVHVAEPGTGRKPLHVVASIAKLAASAPVRRTSLIVAPTAVPAADTVDVAVGGES